MTNTGPPAGWYADPEHDSGTRWWDGSAWTDHRQIAGGQATPPAPPFPVEADGVAQTPVQGTGGLGQVPSDGTVLSQPENGIPWYRKNKLLIIGPIVLVAIIIIVAVAASSGGSGSNQSRAMESSILTNGQSQMQASASSAAPGATVVVNDARCIQTAGTQEYTCIVHYTVDYPSAGQQQRYLLNVAGTCDSNGNCQWHATGPGSPVGG